MSTSTGVRYGPDSPGMRGLAGVIRAYATISGRSTRGRPPTTPIRRELSMRVHDSRRVAEDARALPAAEQPGQRDEGERGVRAERDGHGQR